MAKVDDLVVLGNEIVTLQPTAQLRWFQPTGATVARLQQMFMAHARGTDGETIYYRHEWRDVPTEHIAET